MLCVNNIALFPTKRTTHQGLGGFYKGVASPLYGQMFLNAWQFFIWGKARSLFEDEKTKQISTAGFFGAGAVTGFFVALIESVVDLYKTQLQTQVFKAKPEYTTLGGCVKHIWKANGVMGLTQGMTATIARNTPAVSLYFGFYEYAKEKLRSEGETLSTLPVRTYIIAIFPWNNEQLLAGSLVIFTFVAPLAHLLA